MSSSGGGGRKRWTDRREVREPTLYDEWLKQENDVKKRQTVESSQRQSEPLRQGDTTEATEQSPGTIRAVTPEDSPHADVSASMDGAGNESPIVAGMGSSHSRRFKPHTTTTITGGPAAVGDSPSSQSSAAKPRKLVKERAPSSRNGSSVTGMSARTTSKVKGNHAQEVSDEKAATKSARSGGKASGEQRKNLFPTDIPPQLREKSRSMDVPVSPSSGAEYLASVPAETSPPSVPSIKTFRSEGRNPLDIASQRSTSPAPSTTDDSRASSQRGSSARRILHLMKTLSGRYSGNVLIRRSHDSPWNQIHCSIQEETGDLIYEPKDGESPSRTLVSGLRGCSVRPNADGDTPYLDVNLPQSDSDVHLKLLTQVDFDSWYAALLYWQSLGPQTQSDNNPERPSTAASDTVVRPEVPPRASSARKRRDRTESSKKERRKSGRDSPQKEAPVIKLGRMIFWEASMAHDSTTKSNSQADAGRPQMYRTYSERSRKWRWINGQLHENGELKLYSDLDDNLISVVQLSLLSRCAIQRLDQSVMDDEFCIAIYPQYTSMPSETQPRIIRPIFLSLENRVLYEVWFVLLRAFTIPQLYGPRISGEDDTETDEPDPNQDLENMLTTRTTDMFRMERSLSIKITEARLHPSSTNSDGPESDQSRSQQGANSKVEQQGYYAEVLLDNETRGKTTVKFDTPNPLWAEEFEFLDLPPVLSSASVVIKRRPQDPYTRDQQEAGRVRETSEQQGGPDDTTHDVVCGKVEIYLQELENEKETEKWWPILNMYDQRVGEMLIKARAQEGVILMTRDYQPLSEVLHRFGNGITLQISHIMHGELKRISDCLLNIFQVSGKAGEWIMALAEEEIDGINKETPITKLRFDRRVDSEGGQDASNLVTGLSNRELIVRDMNKTATFEANLLFRGNTLLTKTLDTHMRRVGKEYLEESLGPKLRVINRKDPDCEVDPSRVISAQDKERNWRRLLLCTQEVWTSIVSAKDQCPIELRVIFRHIRACAEDRYGDFLRSVSYSSVSGFLFLRFFCPAVLGPNLFGLMKEDVKPRVRRTFVLIAKSLQTLSNMASFGSKETWMEPMNAFLSQNRASFKSFIDDVCHVPTPSASATYPNAGDSLSTHPTDVASAESSSTYNTPMTVMQRLPPTSREGFPSLPFLIDQPRAFADLVQLWLEATAKSAKTTGKRTSVISSVDIPAAIKEIGGDLVEFHEICTSLYGRTQDCLSRAERAERPNSASSFKWDELIDQLKPDDNNVLDDEVPTQASFDMLAARLVNDRSMALSPMTRTRERNRDWDVLSSNAENGQHSTTKKPPLPKAKPRTGSDYISPTERPSSSGVIGSLRDGLRRAQLQSRGSDSASAGVSNASSAVSSDTEHGTGTTALPNYDRELRHRERRDAAKQQIKQHVEASRIRDAAEKDKRKLRSPIVSALRKKNQRESKNNTAGDGYTTYGV